MTTRAQRVRKWAAFPEESTPINPLANFSDISDIPSRISALLAGGGSSESFKQFGWLAMNQICQALYFLEKRPTLRSILQSLQMGGDDLLEQCVTKYGIEKLGEQTFRDYFDATNPLNEEGTCRPTIPTPQLKASSRCASTTRRTSAR